MPWLKGLVYPPSKGCPPLRVSGSSTRIGGSKLSDWEIEELLANHRDLLKYSEKDAHHRGEYKTQPNSVAAFDETGKQIGIVFETATPFDAPRLMTEVVNWAREELESWQMHPLLIIAIFIVVFLRNPSLSRRQRSCEPHLC